MNLWARFIFRLSGNLEAGDLILYVHGYDAKKVQPELLFEETRAGQVLEFDLGSGLAGKKRTAYNFKFDLKRRRISLAKDKVANVYFGSAQIRWGTSLEAVTCFFDLFRHAHILQWAYGLKKFENRRYDYTLVM